jgi:hypothetical protein
MAPARERSATIGAVGSGPQIEDRLEDAVAPGERVTRL